MTTIQEIRETPRPVAPGTTTERDYSAELDEDGDYPLVEVEDWREWPGPQEGDYVLTREYYWNEDDAGASVWVARSITFTKSRKFFLINGGEQGRYRVPERWGYNADSRAPEADRWFRDGIKGSGHVATSGLAFPWEKDKIGDDEVITHGDLQIRRDAAAKVAQARRDAEVARGYAVRLVEALAKANDRWDRSVASSLLLHDYAGRNDFTFEDVDVLASLLDAARREVSDLREILDGVKRATAFTPYNSYPGFNATLANVTAALGKEG